MVKVELGCRQWRDANRRIVHEDVDLLASQAFQSPLDDFLSAIEIFKVSLDDACLGQGVDLVSNGFGLSVELSEV